MVITTRIEELKAGAIVLNSQNDMLMLATSAEVKGKRKQHTSIFIGYENCGSYKNVYSVLTLHFSPVRIRKYYVESNSQILTLIE